MTPAPRPVNETLRQAAVERLQLVDLGAEDSFDRVARLAARVLETPISAFTVLDDERLLFRASVGLNLHEVPRAQSFCAHAILDEGAILVVEDARLDPRFHDNPLVASDDGLRFYAGVPVMSPDNLPVGTLCVVDRVPRKPSSLELETLRDLASVIERELVLRSLARTDPLTGLYNRRHYELEIEREWRRAMRNRFPVAALMIDVDQFKDYNDTYGHQKGDAVLRQLAQLLGQRFRRSGDLLIRYGGEEFLAVVADTPPEVATQLAEDVRRQVEELDLVHAYSPHQRVTVSIGLAVAVNEDDFLTGHLRLVRLADEALYVAKSCGRNRVSVSLHPVPRAVAV
ncbi:diguanylate cyclase [Phenylobacterium sp.]|uniref:diguanylate cyclase n=1 Tax=Phenylobacterium sp. TaxID=1871053 RepID=UPI002737C2FA|nr:diguanylate cyclase [Phenylobacterium sp.]MDP3870845.1 diguanylate cyclase [Phenylobacterium sp.]